jgi:hypothetical protein
MKSIKASKKAITDINVLVGQISKLKITDSSYAQAYFKAPSLNPLIAYVLNNHEKSLLLLGIRIAGLLAYSTMKVPRYHHNGVLHLSIRNEVYLLP